MTGSCLLSVTKDLVGPPPIDSQLAFHQLTQMYVISIISKTLTKRQWKQNI